MQLVEPKKIIRNLYKKYAIIEGNLVMADKLFIINTVINYIFKDGDPKNISTKHLAEYGEIISRYLKNEVYIGGELHDKVRCDDYRTARDYLKSFNAIAKGAGHGNH